MSDVIIVALITLIGTIITVIATSRSTQTKVTNELQTQNAIQNQKIDQLVTDVDTVKSELTDKMAAMHTMSDYKIDQLDLKQQEMVSDIKEHNGYAKQLPEIQGKLDLIVERQEVANKRIADLEDFQKNITNQLMNKN